MKYSFWNNVQYTLSKAIKHNKKLILRIFIYTISTVGLSILTVYFPKLIIDEVTGARDIAALISVTVVFLLLGVLLSYCSSYFQNRTYSDFHEFRCLCLQEYQQKCFELELEKVESSDFLNKINMAKTCLYDNNKGFEGVLRKIFTLFGTLIILVYYGGILILFQPFLFLLLLINTIIPYFFSYRSKKYEYEKQEELSYISRQQSYTNDLMSDFTYGKEIRLYNMAGLLTCLSDSLQGDIQEIWKNILKKQSLSEVANLLIAFCREGLVYLFLVAGVLGGKLTIGDFVLYTGIFVAFSSLMTETIENVSHIRAQSLMISDYRTFMDTSDEEEGKTLFLDTKDGYSIDFENVVFSYPGSGRKLFQNLNVHIKKGEKIAIVGMNGAGKTTFVKLLCGFYKPDRGRILINGTDISHYSRASVLRLFSVLFQEISFFSMTVGENITLHTKEQIDEGKLFECIKKSGIDEKIQSMKKGIDTTLTKKLDMDGVELSGENIKKWEWQGHSTKTVVSLF